MKSGSKIAKKAEEYNHLKIEKKWGKVSNTSTYAKAVNGSKKPKFYCLVEFPYPSGDGLHVGHVRSYTALDVVARMKRAQGFNVLYPIGWDAFGLPTENYAIKTGKDPRVITKQNTDNFRKQLQSLGISFDWSREVNTTDPEYYRWTQWIFLQFFKKGLAYKARIAINWCPKDKIGLANEEVIDGKCERCGTSVEKREKEQWMLAITKYAERLDLDLDTVDYEERIKIQQRNWIGKSTGAEIDFLIKDSERKVTIFTTRPDTIFGATYLVLSPEHSLVTEILLGGIAGAENEGEIEEYLQKTREKTEIERSTDAKEKTGVLLKGVYAINPATNEEIPVWVADYVLGNYGTGAVMAVPAHDERDFDFAKKYKQLVRKVVSPSALLRTAIAAKEIDPGVQQDSTITSECFSGEGELLNSNKFSGKYSADVKKEITEFVHGKWVTKFKLRDWVFSRQRYWGEPIPIIHCSVCGIVPVSEKDLPVLLPKVKKYEPTDNGESPLASIKAWVNTTCPKCKGLAKRETDTMPQWAGSSWYFLRYTDPKNKKDFASKKALSEWTPVDWYNGGMEHTTLHLLYSRFWHKFLFDQGLVPTSEPYKKRTSHGLILASDGEKMSKSRGNVINPDEIVKSFGADTLRLYEMFMGPFDQAIGWSVDGIVGPRRFIERIWRLSEKVSEAASSDNNLEAIVHKTIEKVTSDIERKGFNTAVSALMVLGNELEKRSEVPIVSYKIFLTLLAPFVPFVTEELWQKLGEKKSVHLQEWPIFDSSKIVSETVSLIVQVNGKMRAAVEVPTDSLEENAVAIVSEHNEVKRWIQGREVKRIIYIKNKIINFVVTIDM